MTERRKVLGDHEKHEVQRLARQHSSSAPHARKERRSDSEASLAQTLCSFVLVGLGFAAFLYWTIVAVMPKDA